MKIVTAIPVKEFPENQDLVKDDVLLIANTPVKPFSLCDKLNTALEWAKEQEADWLCFHHDDLEIQTPELVEPNLRRAESDGVAVAGVIGALALHVPQWWASRPLQTAGAIIQGYKDGHEQLMADLPGYRSDMATVDGCILYIHRKMFDERVNDYGSHLYDDDICLRALAKGFKVGCLDLRCKHTSEGGYDFRPYQDASDRFMEYWRARAEFPIISGQRFHEPKEVK